MEVLCYVALVLRIAQQGGSAALNDSENRVKKIYSCRIVVWASLLSFFFFFFLASSVSDVARVKQHK